MEKSRIVVHCADTHINMDVGAADIGRWHRERGWRAIGYAFVIRQSGALELGRDLDDDGDVLDETGAHARGYNRSSIGICLIGGKPEGNFFQAQLTTLKSVISVLNATFPGIEVLGHRDLPGVTKTCPTFDVRHWLSTGEVVV